MITLEYLRNNNFDFTYTSYNSGICEGINKASKNQNLIIFYMHMTTFILPRMGFDSQKEIEVIEHNNFYLSGTMMNEGQIKYNCGNTPNEFNENRFLNEYKNFNFYDFQGSTWAPSVVHRETWEKVEDLAKNFSWKWV